MEAASSFVRALSPGGSLYLRQKAGGDEEPSGYQSLTGAFSGIKPQSSQSSLRGAGAPLSNVSSDYNYSREESLAKRMDPPTKPVSAAAKKKIAPRPSGGTINIDKQAYKPSVDEEEEDEEEWSEDERGHRRKRAKLGPTQRKLNNLPTVGAHVKHRRGPRRKKANGEDGSETDTPGPVSAHSYYLGSPLSNFLSS
jgi:SUN domain-containing protein 1/2